MGTLILDPRQGSGDLLSLLPQGTELGQLEAGDVMSDGWGPTGPILWGMEIKKLGDALQCLQDNRLAAGQLPRMHEYYQYVFLLIEGEIRTNDKSGYLQKKVRKPNPKSTSWSEYWVDVLYGSRERVVGSHFFEWLISLQLTGGARLIMSADRATTAAWVTAVHRCLGKPWDSHKSLKVFDDSHPPKFVIPSKAAKVARALADGIGWEKAMEAGEHFGSPQALVNATESEWLAVSGIGPELAGRAFAGARETHRHVVRRGTSFGNTTAVKPVNVSTRKKAKRK